VSCVRGRTWSDAEKMRFRRVLATEGKRALPAAFPDRSAAALAVAARRFAFDPGTDRAPTRIDRGAVRRRLARMPLHLIADRLADLLDRSASFGRRVS